jgi:quercetin dioxygenase-like cupin family protein
MAGNLLRPGEGRSVWVVGDRYTILASGEQTGGAYALVEALVPPGGGPPPHIHRREDEAFYVLEGSLTFQSDGQTLAGTPGAWITLPRGSLHSFRNTGATPARMLILVAPAGLERYFLEVGTESAEPVPVTPEAIGRLLAAAPRYGLEVQAPVL